MSKELDLTGTIHGDFTVIEKSNEYFVGPNGKKNAMWNCRCNTCGEIETIQGRYIRNGQHKICNACFARKPDVQERAAKLIKDVTAQFVAAGYSEEYGEKMAKGFVELRNAFRTH